MRYLPKIKSFPKIYFIKSKFREQKQLLKDLNYFFINNTPFNLIKEFLKNHFINKKIKIQIDDFFEKSIFSDVDWFLGKTPLLIKYFEKNVNDKNKIKDILEIGSYEGRSAIFFLNYFTNSKISCVDTWQGSDEHNKTFMNKIEENFNYNLEKYANRSIKYKNTSDKFFENNRKSFDLIYIDGSHHSDQVLKDAENSKKNLNKNGYLLFDDYNFRYAGYKQNENVLNAVNKFIDMNSSSFKKIYIYTQVLLKKIQ